MGSPYVLVGLLPTGYDERVGVAWGGRPGPETVTVARTTSVSRDWLAAVGAGGKWERSWGDRSIRLVSQTIPGLGLFELRRTVGSAPHGSAPVPWRPRCRSHRLAAPAPADRLGSTCLVSCRV